jgi:hypothetical protein|tara:strand:+ start:263 stop:475 length:213 start_codon:yes stop_codon:yes gene_type:complete
MNTYQFRLEGDFDIESGVNNQTIDEIKKSFVNNNRIAVVEADESAYDGIIVKSYSSKEDCQRILDGEMIN